MMLLRRTAARMPVVTPMTNASARLDPISSSVAGRRSSTMMPTGRTAEETVAPVAGEQPGRPI